MSCARPTTHAHTNARRGRVTRALPRGQRYIARRVYSRSHLAPRACGLRDRFGWLGDLNLADPSLILDGPGLLLAALSDHWLLRASLTPPASMNDDRDT